MEANVRLCAKEGKELEDLAMYQQLANYYVFDNDKVGNNTIKESCELTHA